MTEVLSRRERRKQETRREILEAALACFAEHGYHSTGVADIAKRVGVGNGTFYLYFESKRDIVEAVLNDLIERVAAAMSAIPPEAPSTIEDYQVQADQITTALTGVLSDDPRMTRFLLLQAAAVDEAMAERVLDFFDIGAVITSGYFQHGVDAGYFRGDLDVATAARAVNGMLFAAALFSLRNPARDAGAEMARTIREIIYYGMTGSR